MKANIDSDDMHGKKIAAVLVTYFPDEIKLAENLTALERQVDLCIIIDNTPIGIKVNFNFSFPVEYCALNENKGIAFAQNLGIRQALGFGASHVFFIDQDSVVEKNCVSILYSCSERLMSKGVNLAACCASAYDEHYPKGYPLIIEKNGWPVRLAEGNQTIIQVFHSISSGTLIPIDAFKVVGEMNEKLFIDYVDIDWCLRARMIGLSIVVHKDARLSHSLGDSKSRDVKKKGYRYLAVYDPVRIYYQTRNSILVSKMKHASIKWCVWHLPKALILKPILYLIRGPKRGQILSSIIRGMYDGISTK